MKLLAPFAAMGLLAAAPAHEDPTREALIQGYAQVLRSSDKDADGRLSRAEWNGMAETVLKRVDRANQAQIRSALEQQFTEDDQDGDGFVTREELLRAPLESFDCMDTDGDGKLSSAEQAAGMNRCASKPSYLQQALP